MPHLISRTAGEWTRRARAAASAIVVTAGGMPATLHEARDADPVNFARLIEAMVALEPVTGVPVSRELAELAGLRHADEVI